jgi:hypothetical protein
MTERTRTIVTMAVVVLVLSSYIFVGYCAAISRRLAASSMGEP